MKKIATWVLGAAVAVFLVIQVIPYYKPEPNPPVSQEPNWDSPETRAMVKQYCFQCHSNETTWPWYSKVAPSSWLLAYDVAAARSRANFSEWDKQPTRLGEMIEQVSSGEMPPFQYTTFHPDAKMDAATQEAFIAALKRTFK